MKSPKHHPRLFKQNAAAILTLWKIKSCSGLWFCKSNVFNFCILLPWDKSGVWSRSLVTVMFMSSCRFVSLSPGFDRHLLGMYLIAKEEGRPTPELFTDPLYSKRSSLCRSFNSEERGFTLERTVQSVAFRLKRLTCVCVQRGWR